jgi:hypothetical protein
LILLLRTHKLPNPTGPEHFLSLRQQHNAAGSSTLRGFLLAGLRGLALCES